MRTVIAVCLTLCLSAALVLPASALNYTIDAPGDPDYGTPTSVEVIHTADGGALKNEDVSKNAALAPPSFGSPSADTPGTGTYLTPDLAPGGMAVGTMTGGSLPIVFPPVSATPQGGAGSAGNTVDTGSSGGYTYVTDDLYDSGGSLGTLKIPAIDLSVKIYQGTGSGTLARGAGHFTDTSIWDGTIALAGHNRGVNNHFRKIHTLELGDKITLTTKLGTRTYQVTSVSKISETDRSAMTPTRENRIVLYTCVMNQSAYRWCVQAVADETPLAFSLYLDIIISRYGYMEVPVMKIRPSSALRNDYTAISELAKVSGEPIFITNKGEDDGVFMSMAAYEEREKMYRHRDKVYAAEMSRLSGEPVLTPEELEEKMEALFRAYEV